MRYGTRVNELAIVSFVCALASFVFLPGVGAVLAVYLGKRAQREIAVAGASQQGAALADWGISIGYGGLLYVALVLVGLVLAQVILPVR